MRSVVNEWESCYIRIMREIEKHEAEVKRFKDCLRECSEQDVACLISCLEEDNHDLTAG